MHELENERRALRQDTRSDDIETFLTQDCDIAIDRRELCVPASLLGRSVEVWFADDVETLAAPVLTDADYRCNESCWTSPESSA